MASLVEYGNIGKVPELRKRLLFTLAVLLVYRLGVFVTIPGLDRIAMQKAVGGSGGLLGMFNMFTGGALARGSIFALGIMPYITASIAMQVMGIVFKRVEDMRKEGEAGRRAIEKWTRMGTIALSLVQSTVFAVSLEAFNQADMGGGVMRDIVQAPGWGFRLTAIATFTTGTALIMWMGERITESGIGNGISLIIFGSIVAGVPSGLAAYWAGTGGQIEPLPAMIILAVFLISIGTVVFFEKAQRRIPIQYARRQAAGRRTYGGEPTHLPLKVNMASMIPPIFASSLLMAPATLASFNLPGISYLAAIVTQQGWVFNTLFAGLIIFFCFFYTAVTFQPVEVADNLKRQQANIPGIRPGSHTAEYIDRVVSRVTVGGAAYVAAICVIPTLIAQAMKIPFQFGGTSLMIVVGVALETVNQIEAHLITRSYEGLTGPRPTRLSGRRSS